MDLDDVLSVIWDNTPVRIINCPYQYAHVIYEGDKVESYRKNDPIYLEFFETEEVVSIDHTSKYIQITVDVPEIIVEDGEDLVTIDFHAIEKGIASSKAEDIYDDMFVLAERYTY